MSKKPKNIDTYKDGRGAPITESSAHYMNEHGNTFTEGQAREVVDEISAATEYKFFSRNAGTGGTYEPDYRPAARLILQARAERDEWQRKWASATSAAEALAIVERDAALAERDEWKLKFHLGIDDALAARKERDAAQERMREFAAQKAHFMAERDAALVRVREVEDCHERTKELCDVHCERIAALEAENAELRKSFRLACIAISNPDRIAENERLRAAWGKVETMFNWAQFRATDPAMHIRTYLRAALKGEGDE